MPAKRPAGTAATTRLRKLECEQACGAIMRCSRTVMLRGAFTCCCGAQLVPAALEDAHALHAAGILSDRQMDAHPEFELYTAKIASVVHGQGRKGGLHAPNHRNWKPAEAQALDLVLATRAQLAGSSRRNALDTYRPNQPVAPAADPIPF